MSREILKARFNGMAIHPAEEGELDAYPSIEPVLFPDGTLIGETGKSDVYVISGGKRLPIADGETFLSYGWDWNQVIVTNARSVEIHALGNRIDPSGADEQNETESL